MKTKALFVMRLLFGLMMLNGGLNKFLNYMPMPEMPEAAMAQMQHLMQLGWLFPLVALVEIVGGILFIIPKTKALGAIVILPVMVGILVYHIAITPNDLIMTLVFFAINIVVIVENYKKYLPMISK